MTQARQGFHRAFVALLPHAVDVKLALHRRFRDVRGTPEGAQLPAVLRTQLDAGDAVFHRTLVVVVGEGRSATSVFTDAVFNTLPSFTFTYEPCRFTDGLLHGRECARFVAQILTCRLPASVFRHFVNDWAAFSKGRFVSDVHALHGGGSTPFPNDWAKASALPANLDVEALHLAWLARCAATHAVVKTIRIARWAELQPLVDAVPTVRILHFVRDPLHVVASRARIPEFFVKNGEWSANGTTDSIVENVCSAWPTSCGPCRFRRCLLRVRYEHFAQTPSPPPAPSTAG